MLIQKLSDDNQVCIPVPDIFNSDFKLYHILVSKFNTETEDSEILKEQTVVANLPGVMGYIEDCISYPFKKIGRGLKFEWEDNLYGSEIVNNTQICILYQKLSTPHIHAVISPTKQ